MDSDGNDRGCLPGCGGHGCAAVVFAVMLLGVLMVEHAFHIFEGLLWVVVALLALGALVMGAWQVLRWWLGSLARPLPDDGLNASDEGEATGRPRQ